MANPLDSLSPAARQGLMIGVPIVAVFAFMAARSNNASEPVDEEAPSAAMPAGLTPEYSTDAIGTGQLASFESSITDRLNALTTIISDTVNKPANTVTGPNATNKGGITYARANENAATVATRLRAAGRYTVDGRAITSDWIVHKNRAATGGSVSKIITPGKALAY